jgi:sialic acid synthase SpsE
MLEIKRPGTGLSPIHLQQLLGKKTKKSITKDEHIRLNMVE